jgi:hypothetical protein
MDRDHGLRSTGLSHSEIMLAVELVIGGRDLISWRGIFWSNIDRTSKIGRWGFGSGRWRRGHMHMMTCHGRALRLTGVPFFLSYGGQFPVRFAPTGPQWRGKLDYANLSWWRVTAESGNPLLPLDQSNCFKKWWKIEFESHLGFSMFFVLRTKF